MEKRKKKSIHWVSWRKETFPSIPYTAILAGDVTPRKKVQAAE